MSERGTAESYRVFVRNWWRRDAQRVVVPAPGARKRTLATHCTYAEARRIAQRYNETHRPGILSRKAEFEEE